MAQAYTAKKYREQTMNEETAIVDFLERYWEVRLNNQTLPEVVRYILDKGLGYGISEQETQVGKEIETLNSLNSMNGETGRNIRFRKTFRKEELTNDDILKGLEKRIKEETQITASPKGYNTFCVANKDENYPLDQRDLKFNGSKLHDSLGGGCLPFEDALSMGRVLQFQRKGYSPVTTLICFTFQQGHSLGKLFVEDKYRHSIWLSNSPESGL